MEEGGGTDNSQMEDRLLKVYYRWVRQVLRAELNSKNKMRATNTLAVPVDWLKKLRGQSSNYGRNPPPDVDVSRLHRKTKWWTWIRRTGVGM
jgi:hypothetical protein